MSNAKDGGPAFPVEYDHDTFRPRHVDDAKRLMSGMSLRDYFAAKAMQGLITTRHPHHSGEDGADVLSQDAYAIADAMLSVRELT